MGIVFSRVSTLDFRSSFLISDLKWSCLNVTRKVLIMSVCFLGSCRLSHCCRLSSLKTAPEYWEPIPGRFESNIPLTCSSILAVSGTNDTMGDRVPKVIFVMSMVALVPLELIIPQ